jgi:hypothetical protein
VVLEKPSSLLIEHDGLIRFEERPLDRRLRQSVPLQYLIIEPHQHFELCAAEIKFQPVPPRAIKLIHGGLLQNRCEKAAGTGNSLGAAAWPRPPAPASRSPPHNISTPLKTARHRTISQMSLGLQKVATEAPFRPLVSEGLFCVSFFDDGEVSGMVHDEAAIGPGAHPAV